MSRVSVIIPTLDEQAVLADTLRSVRALGPDEIVVVDGGSQDRTRAIAAELADRVLDSERGRARQQNRGAAGSQGDGLLFLHADCRLEAGAIDGVRRALDRTDCVAGCFRQTVVGRHPLYRTIDLAADLRARLFHLPYGDQGIFVRRGAFEAAGGFPEIQLMEDLMLMRTLRRRGRILLLGKRIFVSARRWRRAGIVRQSIRNWALTALAVSGVHPDRLARFYPQVR